MMSLRLEGRSALLTCVTLCAAAVATGAPTAGAADDGGGAPIGSAFDSSGSATGAPATESPVVAPETPAPAEQPPPTGSAGTDTGSLPESSTPPAPVAVLPAATTPAAAGSPAPAPATQAPPAGEQGPADGSTSFGTVGLRALHPFPVVRIRGRVTRTGARITLLLVRAPVGARVSVRCRGRACPLRRAHATRARALRVRSLERELRAGTLVEVSVTRPGLIGKYTRFRIRRRGAPARSDLCLVPGERLPRACS